MTSKRAYALLLVGAALLAGCKGDKPVGGQVVAKVDGTEITQTELKAAMASLPPEALANVPDKQALAVQLLQKVIDRRLLVKQAEKEEIEKEPDFAVELASMREELLVRRLAAKAAGDVQPVDDAAVDSYIAKNASLFGGRKIYALDQLAFPMPKDKAVIGEIEAAHSLDAIAAVMARHNIPSQRGRGQLDSAKIPPALAQKIEALPAGEPFATPQNGAVVASVVTGSQSAPVDMAKAREAARGMMKQEAVNKAMEDRVKQARLAAKIEYAKEFTPPKVPAPAK
jgi:peptidyl-prolyl cis-trans isomerase C